MNSLVEGLNPAQKLAVEYFESPLLILAGAGSGKTRVLTHKIAYGLEKKLFGPNEFLAVTFTNKAAGEMKERLYHLCPGAGVGRESWVSTFHSFGTRVLREFASHLGYNADFTIFDMADQTSLVRSLLKEYSLDASPSQVRKVTKGIGWIKSDLETFENIDQHHIDYSTMTVFRDYQSRLKKNNGMDFSDLLLNTLHLLRHHEEPRQFLQQRFKAIFVDEYQDTNLTQYEIMRRLTTDDTQLVAVGDEDQSIYSWRGANIFNILNFEKDFKKTKVIKLEENYRSTKTIIGAASEVIANNTQRKGKTLFTNNSKGSPIEIFETMSEYNEAETISRSIENLLSERSPQEFAIFYRTNAQSRVLEEQLRDQQIPYRIIGGQKFYDRKEIKDALCYMRLTTNPRDNISFRRVINTPTRGIGKTTVAKIEGFAARNDLSLIEASIQMCQEGDLLKGRAREKVAGFLDLVSKLRQSCIDNSIYQFYRDLLVLSNYLPTLEKEGTVEAGGRIENLEEFGNAIIRYSENNPDNDHISQFLQHMALVSDEEKGEDDSPKVSLMTLHVAKGLEFPVVFVTGLEEGLFPSGVNDASSDMTLELEEERRLFYVGMTRAREELYLTHAQQRRVWGQNQYQTPSRFLKEIPDSFLKEPRKKKRRGFGRGLNSVSSGFSSGAFSEDKEWDSNPFPDYESGSNEEGGYQAGHRVRHPHFGPGVIKSIEGQGGKEKICVLFDDRTERKFLSQYANLEIS